MNIQNTKKLTSTLLVCALMLGGAISASAAEPSKETDQTVASAVMAKAVIVNDIASAPNSSEPVQLRLTRIDGAVPDGVTISVVPMTEIVNLSDTKTDNEPYFIKAVRLVPAKAIPMEKIIVE